jgi:toluene monooxygenase system ferredoxin subunit
MAFVKVSTLSELGGPLSMSGYYVDGVEVLLVRDKQGVVRAFDGICPHEDSMLADGGYDGGAIVCPAHGWVFNAQTGRGISPSSCHIAHFPVQIEGEDILVDTDGDANKTPAG